MLIDLPARTASRPRLAVALARSVLDIRAAQRLRWQVFAEEQGARLDTPEPGLDIDDLDEHCVHLIVTDVGTDMVVGTYRLLTAEAARQAGGYYSEREFDLHAIHRPGQRLLEIGRSCVLPEYRTGATIALLWSGLATFLVESGHDALIGCASIPLRGQETAGARLALTLARDHRGPRELGVTPRVALASPASVSGQMIPVPPLLKGYLRSGAVVCGEPYWDREFNCADLFLHLGLDNMAARYSNRFLPTAGGAYARAHVQASHSLAAS